jgi:hypothetical protein
MVQHFEIQMNQNQAHGRLNLIDDAEVCDAVDG